MDHAFGSTPSAWQHVPEDAFVKVVPGEKWPDGGGHMTQNSNGESDTPLPDDVWDAAFDPDPSNAWVSESSYGRNGIFLQQVRTFYDEELNGEENGLVTAIPLGDAAPTPCVFFDGYSYPLNQFNAEAQ
jgi:hypothetical protein